MYLITSLESWLYVSHTLPAKAGFTSSSQHYWPSELAHSYAKICKPSSISDGSGEWKLQVSFNPRRWKSWDLCKDSCALVNYGHRLEHWHKDDPAWVEWLDKMISRSLFQPQPLSDYVAKVCPYYFAVSSLPGMFLARLNSLTQSPGTL